MVAHHQSKSEPICLNPKDFKAGRRNRYSLSYSHQKNQTHFESGTRRKLVLRRKHVPLGHPNYEVPATITPPTKPMERRPACSKFIKRCRLERKSALVIRASEWPRTCCETRCDRPMRPADHFSYSRATSRLIKKKAHQREPTGGQW